MTTKTRYRAAAVRVLPLCLALTACLIAAGCDGSSTGPADDEPDARPIVYFRLDDSPGWTIYRASAAGGTPTRLELPVTATLYPAISPDGSRLAFLSESVPGGLYVSALDGTGARLVYSGGEAHITWSPDGARLAVTVGGDIVVVNVDGTGTQTITANVDIQASYPSWSATGRIAFMTATGDGVSTDIYTMAADGSDVRRIVAGEGQEARDPAWSPDGSRLAFALGQYGSSSIYTVNANGNDRRRVTPEPEWGFGGTDLGPAWAPSGRWIAFQRDHVVCPSQQCNQRYDILVVRADGGEVRNVTDGSPWGGVRPSW